MALFVVQIYKAGLFCHYLTGTAKHCRAMWHCAEHMHTYFALTTAFKPVVDGVARSLYTAMRHRRSFCMATRHRIVHLHIYGALCSCTVPLHGDLAPCSPPAHLPRAHYHTLTRDW